MIRTMSVIGACAFFLASSWGSALATQEQGDWVTGFYAGYSASLEENAPSGSIGLLFYASKLISNVFGGGLEIGIHRLGSQEIDPVAFPQSTGVTVGEHAWQLTGNARVMSDRGTIRPFATGGLGVYWTVIEAFANTQPITGTGTDANFGYNLGGGLAIGKPTSQWSFGIDGRWHSIPSASLDGSALDILTIYAGFNFVE